jgi:hypothetical protein
VDENAGCVNAGGEECSGCEPRTRLGSDVWLCNMPYPIILTYHTKRSEPVPTGSATKPWSTRLRAHFLARGRRGSGLVVPLVWCQVVAVPSRLAVLRAKQCAECVITGSADRPNMLLLHIIDYHDQRMKYNGYRCWP